MPTPATCSTTESPSRPLSFWRLVARVQALQLPLAPLWTGMLFCSCQPCRPSSASLPCDPPVHPHGLATVCTVSLTETDRLACDSRHVWQARAAVD